MTASLALNLNVLVLCAIRMFDQKLSYVFVMSATSVLTADAASSAALLVRYFRGGARKRLVVLTLRCRYL